jgi:hypothetical protein
MSNASEIEHEHSGPGASEGVEPREVATPPAEHVVANLTKSSTRLGDQIMDWFEAAVERFAEGDQVLWDIALLPLPPDGQPAYYVAMWIPGAVLGTNVHSALTVKNPAAATEQAITDMTHDMIEVLRQQRSQQITLTPTGNGDHPHPHP